MWSKHPKEFAKITIYGKKVNIPRWVGLYGDRQYYYSAGQATVKPTSELPRIEQALVKIKEFQKQIGHSTKGYGPCLVNWYDASLGHYIGHHSDNELEILKHSNIWTISYGATRCFELKNKLTKETTRVTVEHGDALIMGGKTQETHTHSVIKPRVAERNGKRISLTFRAFRPS